MSDTLSDVSGIFRQRDAGARVEGDPERGIGGGQW